MISQTAEYALRAIVYLAERGEPQTIQQIAHSTKVPAGYLSKVMQNLGRHGLVRSQRGLGGGFSLRISPERMSIYAVVAAVDPLQRITSCPLDLPAHRHNLCALHRRLDEAMAMVERVFRETTIAEILARPIFLENACLRREPAAVDGQEDAVDIVAGGGGEEDGSAGQIVGAAPASGGDTS